MKKVVSKDDTHFDDPLNLISETNLELINRAVYGNNLAHKSMVAQNPLLSKEHCRHLIRILDYPFDRVMLIRNPVFPSELLLELSNTENDPYILGLITTHEMASDEAKVMAILRGAKVDSTLY